MSPSSPGGVGTVRRCTIARSGVHGFSPLDAGRSRRTWPTCSALSCCAMTGVIAVTPPTACAIASSMGRPTTPTTASAPDRARTTKPALTGSPSVTAAPSLRSMPRMSTPSPACPAASSLSAGRTPREHLLTGMVERPPRAGGCTRPGEGAALSHTVIRLREPDGVPPPLGVARPEGDRFLLGRRHVPVIEGDPLDHPHRGRAAAASAVDEHGLDA